MNTPRYDPQAIEPKWQVFWDQKKIYRVSEDASKPKYYVLDMFPYPSGTGLHVGHTAGYTATDCVARFKRQCGFNVLHPMGWDSFGLPAEQYAVRTGQHPMETTLKNTAQFRKQLSRLGYCYDWDRELWSSDPKFYKWTQWIFTKLYEKGLAYEAEMLVNYCPELRTVLANEEVEDGRSKEGGYPVIRKPLRQWVLKITAYADRLLADLEDLDWPESLKKLQSNWIGRSEGTFVDFDRIRVFTTRPDTLSGTTYVVLAPEHPLVAQLTTENQKADVARYLEKIASESDQERTDVHREKSGVWTGSYALHPLTGEQIPVWIADYVLMGYGTGAVMGVPAHDERDFQFATLYKLPIIPAYSPTEPAEKMTLEETQEAVANGKLCWTGEGIYSWHDKGLDLRGLSVHQAIEAVIVCLEQIGKGERTVTYKLRDWLFSRQRYWGEPFPLLHFEDGSVRMLDLDELPLTLPEVEDYRPAEGGQSPLDSKKDWVEIVDPKSGKRARRETNTMPNWAGSCWYYLRFCDPHNAKEAWSPSSEKYWMPVDLYVGGVEHAVLHLLYARFWHKVLYDCGFVTTKEPFLSLRNQGLVVARSYQRDNGTYVDPVDVEERDGKYFERKTGLELRSQIEKMSKSKLNGVSPDEIIDEYGADTLRVFMLFLGPLEKEKVWNDDAVAGARRFLSRFYDLCVSQKVSDEENKEALKLAHRLAHAVAQDILLLQFNTAIAKLMTFVNDFGKLSSYPKIALRMAAQALAPFAPHLAEEVWQHLGGEGSVVTAAYPKVDERYLVDDTVTYIVQVNGRMRGSFELPKHQTREQIMDLAKSHPQISKYLEGEIQKLVFVPDKLINIVVKTP